MSLCCRGLSSRALATLVVLVLAVAGQQAVAQQLPKSLLKTSGHLSDQQQQTIEQFIKPRVKQLIEGDSGSVVQARQQLLAPLGDSDASSDFKNAYSQVLLGEASKGLRKNRLVVRLNAIIVIAHLTSGNLIGPAEVALHDKNPAVRYWGAKTLKQYVARTGAAMPGDQQRQIQRMLYHEVGHEQSSAVLEQVFLSMVAIGKNHHHQLLFRGLDSRLAYHAAHPRASYMAEFTGLQALFVQLVQAKANGQNVGAAFKRLSSIAIRYYMQAVGQLQHQKNLRRDQVTSRSQVIAFCDQILRYAVGHVLGGNASMPAGISTPLQDKRWSVVAQIGDGWQQLLSQAPYNFTAKQLNPPGS